MSHIIVVRHFLFVEIVELLGDSIKQIQISFQPCPFCAATVFAFL